MNTRAYNLETELRAILDTLPGANSIELHLMKTCTFILITTPSDEAVIPLSEELGLGRAEIRTFSRRWRRRASSERGEFRVVVTGPNHRGAPPP